MDVLLDWMTFRTFAAVGVAAALLFGIERYRGYADQWYDRWRHPAVGAAVGGEDIAADLQRRESLRLHSLHRLVSDEIARAQSQGLDVKGFQAAADAVLAFDNARYRDAAIERLYKIRLAIPQRPEQTRPASLNEAADDEIPTPKTSSAARRR
jgi:hypothetical protein